MMIHDGWFEILVQVDPSTIFDCILICKACLEVITSPEFRQAYRKKWKNKSKLVGFVRSDVCYSKFKLLATSELGRNMYANKPKRKGLFMSKSGAGDGLILYGVLPYSLYVSKPGEDPVQLPRPNKPLNPMWVTTAILSQNNSYKVILKSNHNDYSDDIHTFSPSTGKWDDSKPRVRHKLGRCFPYRQNPGIASSSRGLGDYGNTWVSWVGVYDDNNEEKPVTWLGPYSHKLRQGFGLSSNGCLLKGAPQGYGDEEPDSLDGLSLLFD